MGVQQSAEAALLSVVPLAVTVTCAVHSYRVARRQGPPARRAWYSRWYGLAAFPVQVLTIGFLVRSFLYEPFRIPSASMHPTIPEGSYVIVSKAGFGQYGTFGIQPWRRPATAVIARGDVVVHRLPADPAVSYVRRVVGLPGDHVQYRDRQLTINGRAVPVHIVRDEGEYRYATEALDGRTFTVAFMPGRPCKDFDQVLPPGEYALFGDNRDNARDSRYVGLIRQGDIVGRVAKVFPPRTPQSP
jgi:signal peptidase I